jgi:hypothetical protein
MCLIPRTTVFISKPKKYQEENKFLRQKIKEQEDKVYDLKSDAKRRKIISYNHIRLWLKLKKVFEIQYMFCFIVYFHLSDKQQYLFADTFLLDEAPTWLSD